MWIFCWAGKPNRHGCDRYAFSLPRHPYKVLRQVSISSSGILSPHARGSGLTGDSYQWALSAPFVFSPWTQYVYVWLCPLSPAAAWSRRDLIVHGTLPGVSLLQILPSSSIQGTKGNPFGTLRINPTLYLGHKSQIYFFWMLHLRRIFTKSSSICFFLNCCLRRKRSFLPFHLIITLFKNRGKFLACR